MVERCGRFPGCLTYDWRVKWILVESTDQPSPIDIVLLRLGRCSSLLQVRKGVISM